MNIKKQTIILYFFYLILFLNFFTLLAQDQSNIKQNTPSKTGIKENTKKINQTNQNTKKSTNKKTPSKNKSSKKSKKTIEKTIELNFSNVDILALIQVMNKVSNHTFMYDEKELKGKKITLISHVKFTPEEAFDILESTLDAYGISTIREKNFVRIVLRKNAQKINSTLNPQDKKITNQYITRIIEVKHGSATSLKSTLNPLMPRFATLIAYNPANVLIIRDTIKNIERIQKIIQILDRGGSEDDVHLIPLEHSNATRIANMLKQISKTTKKKGSSNEVKLVTVDDRTNRIILVSNNKTAKRIENLIKQLDTPLDKGSQLEQIPIYFSDVKSIADILKQIFNYTNKKNDTSGVKIIPFTQTNTLLVRGNKKVIEQMKAIVKRLDQDAENLTLELIELKFANAKELAGLVNQIFQQSTKQGKGVSTSLIKIFADNRTNQLIVLARASSLEKIKALVTRLDQKIVNYSGNYRVYRLNNSKAEEIAKVLQQVTKSFAGKAKTKTTRSNTEISIIPDSASNSLVIYANAKDFPLLENVIQDLDIVRPQVYVEALILEMGLTKSLNLGVDWKFSQTTTTSEGQALLTTGAPDSGGAPSTFESSITNGSGGSLVGLIGAPITFGDQQFSSFSAFIKASQEDSDVNILANPQLLTLNKQEAEIKVNEVVPYLKETLITTNGEPKKSYEYKEVGITLKITPQINADNTVNLQIEESTKELKSGGETPVTLERSITTSVVVEDSSTIVLGGLISEVEDNTEQKVPCLGDIPILGYLFKTQRIQTRKTNLLVFITPRVVRNNQDLDKVIEKSKERLKSSQEGRFKLDVSKELSLPTTQEESAGKKILK